MFYESHSEPVKSWHLHRNVFDQLGLVFTYVTLLGKYSIPDISWNMDFSYI